MSTDVVIAHLCRVLLPILMLPIAPAWAQPVVPAELATDPFHQYEEAPGTPDADDIAIWIHPRATSNSLIIGTLKDGGLVVYDLSGRVVQTMAPPNLPVVTAADPPTPVGLNPGPAQPCPGSESGETFGRFNNVDIAYNVALGTGRHARRADVAVVSDRGCDRLRFYRIVAGRPEGPLVDITDADVPRVHPWRITQPSPLQPSGMPAGLHDNPVDTQDNAYGVGLWRKGDRLYAFVSQRSRSLVGQVEIVATSRGTLTYRPVRVFLFDVLFSLPRHQRRLAWTPCREEAIVDPQAEGIVIDQDEGVLYVAVETVGIYTLKLDDRLPRFMIVGRGHLMDVAQTFGLPYQATPDDGEFSCEYQPTEPPTPDTIVADGTPRFAGRHLQIDVEGLTIYYGKRESGYLIASSQGSSTLHVYSRLPSNRHLGSFQVEGVEETDGLDVANVPLGAFPFGLLVVHNGAAPEPRDTSPINEFEYDGSTQWKFVRWDSVALAFDDPLRIDPFGHDPRRHATSGRR
jgi:3-phytase